MKTEFNIGDELFNRYKIIDIKKGGMGLVYIAVDIQTNDLIAIKTFQEKFLQNDSVVDAFLGEAERWVSMGKHTNIVWAQEVDRIDGKPYIFMEYVDGGSLQGEILETKISLEKAMDIGLQFCTGMIFAYEKAGIIHCDIKPGNIMMTKDGVIKITDFGIARSVEDINTSGFYTPKYASPEQIKEARKGGKSKLTAASDIYSFGLVMYNLLTKGRMPFTAKTSDEWIECHLYDPPKNIESVNTKLPDALCDIIMRCLEKEPKERYESFSDLQDEMITVYEKITGEQYIIRGREESIEGSNIESSQVHLGLSATLFGKYDAAILYYERALSRFIDKGDKQGQSPCYLSMGLVAWNKGDYEQALDYYNKVLEIDIELGNKKGQSECYSHMGSVAEKKGDYKQALDYYNKSLEIALALRDKQEQAKCYTNMGVVARNKGDYDLALEYYNKSLKITLALGDKSGQSECYTNMGLVARNRGDYEQALDYYNKSLEIALALGDKQGQTICYIGMGLVVRNKGDYEQALDYYNKSLEIDLALGDKLGQSECYNDMGEVAQNKGDYEQALDYYNKSLEIDLALDNKLGQSKCYTNMGEVALNKGENEQALDYYNKSLKIKLALGDKQGQSECYMDLGSVALKKGDYEQALEYNNKSFEIALAIGDKYMQSTCYQIMGILSEYNLKDYNKAIKYYEKALELNIVIGLDTSKLEKNIEELKKKLEASYIAKENKTQISPKDIPPKEKTKSVIKEYACPYCNKTFSAEVEGKPVEVYCPKCKERVTVM